MTEDISLTAQKASNLLHYDPETGEFTWRITINSRGKAGARAGTFQRMQNGKLYYSITYEGRKYTGSRMAWLLYYGQWPDRSVFYIDGNSENLRISNLKLADHKSNKIINENGSVKYVMSKIQARHYGLARNYNISLTDYARMFAAQGGVCAICKKPETAKIPGRKTDKSEGMVRDLSVDHCHKNGNIRELLCNSCNHMLGAAKDDEKILIAAAEYLKKHAIVSKN